MSLPVSKPLRIVNRCCSDACKWWYVDTFNHLALLGFFFVTEIIIRYVHRAGMKTAGDGMSATVRQPIRRQFKSLYDEAAENEPPPWAQPDTQKPGFIITNVRP